MKYHLIFILAILFSCTPDVIVKKIPCPEPEPIVHPEPVPCEPVPCEAVPCTEPETASPEPEIIVGVVNIKRVMDESAGGRRLIERFNNTREAEEYIELKKSGSNKKREKELKKILLKRRQKLYLEAFGLIGWALEEKLSFIHLVISKNGQSLWPSNPNAVITKIFIEKDSFNTRDITEDLISAIK